MQHPGLPKDFFVRKPEMQVVSYADVYAELEMYVADWIMWMFSVVQQAAACRVEGRSGTGPDFETR